MSSIMKTDNEVFKNTEICFISDHFRREKVEIIRTQIFAAANIIRSFHRLSLWTITNIRMRSFEKSRFTWKKSQVENRLYVFRV